MPSVKEIIQLLFGMIQVLLKKGYGKDNLEIIFLIKTYIVTPH